MYTIIQVGQICLAHPPAILTLAPALAPSRCPLSPRARCRRQEARASAGLVPPLAPAPRPRRRPRHSAYCRRRRPRAPAPTALRPCIVPGQIGTASFQSAPRPAARVDAPPPAARADVPQDARTLRRRLPARPPSSIRTHASPPAGGTAAVPNPPSAARAAVPQSERGAPAPPLAACAAAAPSPRAHSAVADRAAAAPARAAVRPLHCGLEPTSRRRR